MLFSSWVEAERMWPDEPRGKIRRLMAPLPAQLISVQLIWVCRKTNYWFFFFFFSSKQFQFLKESFPFCLPLKGMYLWTGGFRQDQFYFQALWASNRVWTFVFFAQSVWIPSHISVEGGLLGKQIHFPASWESHRVTVSFRRSSSSCNPTLPRSQVKAHLPLPVKLIVHLLGSHSSLCSPQRGITGSPTSDHSLADGCL